MWSPEADAALLIAAAETAGDVALSFFKRDPKSWEKDEGAGPVTEADLAANESLLSVLRAARPDYGVLSEELPDDAARLQKRAVFIIDPIDGTRAFIAGEKGWCVAVAVVVDGRAVAAAAHFPVTGVTYDAHLGGGARRDGGRIVASDAQNLGGGRVLAAASQLDPRHWPGGAPPMRRLFRPSLTHRLCMVADGGAEAVISFRPVWEWDFAPGALIATEGGCVVTDGQGATPRYNAPTPRPDGLIAAPPALHAALRARRPR